MTEMTPEQIVRILKVMEAEKIRANLPEVIPTEREKLLRMMETKSTKDALAKARKPKRKKGHWKTRLKKNREYMRPYMAARYRNVIVPMMRKELEAGDWYSYYVRRWKKRGQKFSMTRQEWEENVKVPDGQVPTVWRLDTKKPICLESILVKDRQTGIVYFDGHEYALRRMGAVLDSTDAISPL